MIDQTETMPLVGDRTDTRTVHSKVSNEPSTLSAANTAAYGYKKRPHIVFASIMVLAWLAGPVLTAFRKGDGSLHYAQTFALMGSHNSYMDSIQNEATRAFQENLYRPTLQAEMFHSSASIKKEEAEPQMGDSIHRFNLAEKAQPPPPEGCQATVVLLRHCEKGSIREHCNAIGFERARYIATLFGDEPEARWPAPSYLFATAPGQRNNDKVHNWREVETLQPLSNKTGVQIDDQYGINNEEKFAKHIFHLLRSGEMCGKVAVVSWKHEDMAHLARKLGCGPEDGCPSEWAGEEDFDSTWQILYSYHKQLYPSFAIEDKRYKHKVWGQHPEWWISGYVEMENFDPLEFGKLNGVY
jgi:hypothetical protein